MRGELKVTWGSTRARPQAVLFWVVIKAAEFNSHLGGKSFIHPCPGGVHGLVEQAGGNSHLV